MSAGTSRTAGIILAGGRGTRMGGAVPKPLMDLCGRSLVGHVVERIGTSLSPLVVSAGDPAAYAALGLAVVADRVPGHLGPLAGIDAGAERIRGEAPEVGHILTVAADTPFLPRDLVKRLYCGAAPTRPRVARCAGRLHPLCALWPLAALGGLAAFLTGGGGLAVRRYLDLVGWDAVDFDQSADAPDGDPFFNANTPDDLATARCFIEDREARQSSGTA